MPDERVRRRADQDLVRTRSLLEAGRDVHSVSRDKRLLGCGIAGYNVARVDSRPDDNPSAKALLKLDI